MWERVEFCGHGQGQGVGSELSVARSWWRPGCEKVVCVEVSVEARV